MAASGDFALRGTPRKGACSGHGVLFEAEFDDLCRESDMDLDPLCEAQKQEASCRCFQCYEGDSCEKLVENCAVDTRVAELTLSRPWWSSRESLNRPVSSAMINRNMAYLGNSRLFLSASAKSASKEKGLVEPPRSPVSKHLNSAIRALHTSAGNVKDVEEYNLVVGAGGVQMLNAAMYAMNKKIERETLARNESYNFKSRFTAQAPHYSHFKIFADSRGEMSWDAEAKVSTEHLVEIITSPNNPDGKRSSAKIQQNRGLQIHDHVYHWPSILDADEENVALDDELMVFSLSKLTGYAASRIGWALVKDPLVAKDMASYVWLQSTHASVEAQYSAVRAIRTILRSLNQDYNFFSFMHDELRSRWASMENAMNASSQSKIEHVGVAGGPCAWLKCTSRNKTACSSQLRDAGIVSEGGQTFGASPEYTRVCIASERSNFELFLQRLKDFVRSENLGRGNWSCAECQDHFM